MTGSVPNIPVLADIGDLLEFLIPIAFFVIYMVGNGVKALTDKKEQNQHRQKSLSMPAQEKGFGSDIPSVRRPTQAQPPINPRAQRLPYARASRTSPPPPMPQQEQSSYLQKMEELKQRRLAQIRSQQQQQRTHTRPYAEGRPTRLPPQRPIFFGQTRSASPLPVQEVVQTIIPVAEAIAAEETVKPAELIGRKKPGASQKKMQDVSSPPAVRDLRKMLRDNKLLRNAIVASEILGKPVSLR